MSTPMTKPNILILMTDQQRQVQHFPENFTETYLPNLSSLMENGVTFENALTNSCRCSPVRAMLWTGLYPPWTGVYAITPNMELDPTLPTLGYLMSHGPGVTLPPADGQQAPPTSPYYNVAYNGKWHCYGGFVDGAKDHNWPSPGTATSHYQEMLDNWGMPAWQPPDAGTTIDIGNGSGDNTIGGGPYSKPVNPPSGPPTYDYGTGGISPDYGQPDSLRIWNDKRYADNVITFLEGYNSDLPFLAVASLVNPHDVWMWQLQNAGDPNPLQLAYPEAYYYIFGQGDKPDLDPVDGYFIADGVQQTPEDFMTGFVDAFNDSDGNVQAWLDSGNFQDDLSLKPTAHTIVQEKYTNNNPPVFGGSQPDQETQALQYLTFYGYLTYLSDVLLGQICAQLDQTTTASGDPLSDNTVIVRIADHGETGWSHLGMMEKDINLYQETVRVPMTFSSKKYWNGANYTAPVLAGTVDILPTILEMAGLDLSDYQNANGEPLFQGVSLNGYLNATLSAPPAETGPQSATLFTYNDNRYWAIRGVLAAPGTYTVGDDTIQLTSWTKYAVYYSRDYPQIQAGEPFQTYDRSGGGKLYVQFELYEDYTTKPETNNILSSLQPRDAWTTAQTNMHALLTQLMADADKRGPLQVTEGGPVTPPDWSVIVSGRSTEVGRTEEKADLLTS